MATTTLNYGLIKPDATDYYNIEDANENADKLDSALKSLTDASSAHAADQQNPHRVTATQTGAVPVSRTVNGKPLTADILLSKGDVGLGNVENTADSVKRVSYAATAGSAPASGGTAANVPWDGVTEKPTVFPPSQHTHDDRYYTKAQADDLYAMLDAHAPAEVHRNVFRGHNLGGAVTAEQKDNIRNGSFKGLFLGDYWRIGGVNWRIADFNYWFNCGDTNITIPHMAIMPDTILYSAQMNETNTTTGGYVGSIMYTANLNQAKTMASSAFGNLLHSHREYLVNAVTSGKPSGGAWYNSTLELPNEIMIYGSYVFTPATDGQFITDRFTTGNSQLALMRQIPRFIKTRETYWLRGIASATYFSRVDYNGTAACGFASDSYGVRPVFLIANP